MKPLRGLLTLSCLLFLSGCLFTEVEEIRIRPVEPGMVVAEVEHTFQNISSGAEDAEHQQEDFEYLLEMWQGQQFLDDALRESHFVQSRNVYIEDGQVMARVLSRMDDYVKFYDLFKSNGEIIMVVEEDPHSLGKKLTETNARIIETPNNKVLVWPENATELFVRFAYLNPPKEYGLNQPAFAARLQAYLDKDSS